MDIMNLDCFLMVLASFLFNQCGKRPVGWMTGVAGEIHCWGTRRGRGAHATWAPLCHGTSWKQNDLIDSLVGHWSIISISAKFDFYFWLINVDEIIYLINSIICFVWKCFFRWPESVVGEPLVGEPLAASARVDPIPPPRCLSGDFDLTRKWPGSKIKLYNGFLMAADFFIIVKKIFVVSFLVNY